MELLCPKNRKRSSIFICEHFTKKDQSVPVCPELFCCSLPGKADFFAKYKFFFEILNKKNFKIA